MVLLNSIIFYVSFIFIYRKNFMCPAYLGKIPILEAQSFVRFCLFLISAHSKNLIHLAETV